MKIEELEAFAQATAKHMKTEDDFKDFSRILRKITVEAALNHGKCNIFNTVI